MLSYNNENILFSGSLDLSLKAWKLVNNNSLQCVFEQKMVSPINCLQLTKPQFLVIGLVSGAFVGFDATSNIFINA